MSKKNKPKKTSNSLECAIKQVEHYITDINPRNYNDIKIATYNISKAAIGAYLSVHTINETLDFINQIAHTMVNDISKHMTIPQEDLDKIH